MTLSKMRVGITRANLHGKHTLTEQQLKCGDVKGKRQVRIDDRTIIFVNGDITDEEARERYQEKLDRSYQMLIRTGRNGYSDF